MNEVKVEKVPIIACYTCSFTSELLQEDKIWWLFAQLYKNSTDCFELEVISLSRFQIKIESVLHARRKEIKFYI